MPLIIQKKIQKEARRYKVSIDDLTTAVKVIQLESSHQVFDADFQRSTLEKPSSELWAAALRVQEFINEEYKIEQLI